MASGKVAQQSRRVSLQTATDFWQVASGGGGGEVQVSCFRDVYPCDQTISSPDIVPLILANPALTVHAPLVVQFASVCCVQVLVP
eukprot:CAMPEP_0184384162 /NCGR_PEP_ID=MMETSP0007-20130409/7704_1 /TAXON_ID=97485 /ORGANISM="Prymnesium parvum, Strain Texoma1" /LENGTH=84 /DNA_ID=CAMNT_0026730935 /DNA_START=717 /DNA_END=971 /DNA_ORIENTATION=-